jgi:hypothetical protein
VLVVKEIRPISDLDDGQLAFLEEVLGEKPDWAAEGLALFVATSGSPHQGTEYYVAPRSSPAQCGQEIQHVGRWEQVWQRASVAGDTSVVALHVVDRLYTQGSEAPADGL